MEILLGAGGQIIRVALTDVNVVKVCSLVRNTFVAHQWTATVSTEDQAPQDIGDRPQGVMTSKPLLIGAAGLYGHFLNRTEGFFIHQRLMGVADDHPLGFRHIVGLFPLGEAGPLASLDHVTQVDLGGQDFFYGGYGPPGIGIGFALCRPLQAEIPSGGRDFLLIQGPGNPLIAHPRQTQGEYLTHHRRSLRVRLNPVGITGTLLVAVCRP